MEKTADENPAEPAQAPSVKMESEKDTAVEPTEVNKHPKIIKEAQTELGKLDILVCGECHSVFHFIEQFQEHHQPGNCTGHSTIRENNINETKAQVWAFLLWKGSQNVDENENSWVVYQRWCKMDAHAKEAWVTAGKNVQVFTKLSAAKMQEVRAKVPPVARKPLLEDDTLEEGEIKNTINKQINKNNKLIDMDEEDPLADTDDPLDTESEIDTEEEAEREAELEKLKNAAKANCKKITTNDKENNDGNKKDDSTAETTEKTDGVKKVQNTLAVTPVVKKIQMPLDKTSRIAKRTDKVNNTEKEHVVEKILAKRFNPRRKLHEYLLKWEGLQHEQNTWEAAANLDTCKHLLEAFERNLARQKEQKAAQAAAQAQLQKQQKANQKVAQPGTSGVATTPGGRPQRTSKQKALNQVKQWCGNISDRDDDLLLKRGGSSSSDEEPDEKRMKMELDSGSEDEWTNDAPEPERTGLPGRPRILSKSANTINGVAKKMTANEVAKSIGLASPDRPNSPQMLLANNKNVVKVYQRQSNLPSGVYMVNRKDGIVNVNATSGTPTASIVRVVQKSATGTTQNIMRVGATKVGQTQHVRILQKPEVGNSTNVVRLSPGMSKPGTNLTPKPKTTIRPAVRVVQTPGQKVTAQRVTVGTPQVKVVGRGRTVTTTKPTFPFDSTDTTHDRDSDSSEDDYDPFPADLPPPPPDSPPREFTLDPMTGLILGQAEGEPEPQIMPETPAEQTTESKTVQETDSIVKEEHKEPEVPTVVLPDAESILPDSGVQETHPVVAATPMEQATATISLPETGEPLMITGEDGVVYRVAGQNEEGQTLLVAQGVDGEQQCVYVTASVDESQAVTQAEASNVLTLDGAVAEAVDGTTDQPQVDQPLTVDTSELVGVEQTEESDPNSQVVAQLVKAELPSPGGTRKVVLLLPDGNLLMTEVDAEQYEALELDK